MGRDDVMTQKEVTQQVLEAYRRGYLDGVSDRPESTPAQIVPTAPLAAEMQDILALSLQNMAGFDGVTPQEDINETIRRRRNEGIVV